MTKLFTGQGVRWLAATGALVALAGGAGLALRAYQTTPRYLAEATVAVNLDPWRTRQLGEAPPAEQHAELLGELMQTDAFVIGALQRLEPEAIPPAQHVARAKAVREHWRHRPAGGNTISISYACAQPAGCAETVSAVLAAFQEEVTNARQAKRRALIASLQGQAQAIEQSLQGVAADDPAAATARQSLTAIQNRLTDAQIEATAELQGSQAEFRLIAPAQTTAASGAALKAALPRALGGVLLAMMIAFSPLAATALAERGLRDPDAVREQLGAPTVAVVPRGAWDADARWLDAGPRAQPEREPVAPAVGWSMPNSPVYTVDHRLGALMRELREREQR